GTKLLRSLFDFRSNIRGDGDQMMARDVFANFVEILCYVGNEILRSRMLALDLFEGFNGRLVWINLLCGAGKSCLFRFYLLHADLENFFWRKIDKLGLSHESFKFF